jgi:hypothetical protein
VIAVNEWHREVRESIHVARAEQGDKDLALDHGAVWCDVSAFDGALRDGYLAAALALYRDELSMDPAPETQAAVARWRTTG